MYGVSVCTTCMSVHSSHRRHALSFLFIDLGLKILKPEKSISILSLPILLSTINLKTQQLYVLCWLFMLVVRVVQTATSKQRTKVLCALLVYLKDTANGHGSGWYVVLYGVHLTEAEMKFCQMPLHPLFKQEGVVANTLF